MKKFVRSVLGVSMCVFIGFSFCNGEPFWLGGEEPDAKFPFDELENIRCDQNTDLGSCVSIREDKEGGEQTIIRRLLHIFDIDVDETSEHKFLDYVKAILNIALGLLSMVALIMTIYTFYLMFFTENDKAAGKAKGNLVGIFIALAIIGLSWLIVSFIFWRYQSQWQSRNHDGNITMINYEIDNRLNDQIYLAV